MQKKNILIVDDEWNMRNLLKHFLQKENWMIDEASVYIPLERYKHFKL